MFFALMDDSCPPLPPHQMRLWVVYICRDNIEAALNLVSHYAKRYRVLFNASKTKIVVTGSRQDMAYYYDTSPWTLNGGKVAVVHDNEHLGLLVSGQDEEQKHILVQKCPLWATWSCPIL